MASLGEGQIAPSTIPRDRAAGPSPEPWRARPAPLPKPGEQSISSLIEGEIIPRLMIAHSGDSARGDGAGNTIAPQDVRAFVPLVIDLEADELMTYVERMLDRGVSVEALLVDLLAPAARALGVQWEEDEADFVVVTMALWRLQEVAHELSNRVPAVRAHVLDRRRALFAPAPGEQHGFGALVVEEVFARAGWSTDRLVAPRSLDLIDRVAGEWFDLVGLTVSCDGHTGALTAVITAMRSVSRNPRLCVMVGGRVFVDDPELAGRIGADATAHDARVATRVAAGLVDAASREAAARH